MQIPSRPSSSSAQPRSIPIPAAPSSKKEHIIASRPPEVEKTGKPSFETYLETMLGNVSIGARPQARVPAMPYASHMDSQSTEKKQLSGKPRSQTEGNASKSHLRPPQSGQTSSSVPAEGGHFLMDEDIVEEDKGNPNNTLKPPQTAPPQTSSVSKTVFARKVSFADEFPSRKGSKADQVSALSQSTSASPSVHSGTNVLLQGDQSSTDATAEVAAADSQMHSLLKASISAPSANLLSGSISTHSPVSGGRHLGVQASQSTSSSLASALPASLASLVPVETEKLPYKHVAARRIETDEKEAPIPTPSPEKSASSSSAPAASTSAPVGANENLNPSGLDQRPATESASTNTNHFNTRRTDTVREYGEIFEMD